MRRHHRMTAQRAWAYTRCIGWTLLVGIALVVGGAVMLALVDAPRRLRWRLRRGGQARPPRSEGRRDADPDGAGLWVAADPEPRSGSPIRGRFRRH